MKQLEFGTLRLFVAVAESGSLSAAAEQASIAVAAVSKRISDLEASSGTRFFERHARGMHLTPAGRELLQHAREILFSVDRMQAELGRHARGAKGLVRVAATGSAVAEFLPADLKAFYDRHPNIEIELSEWTSQRVVDAVLDGHVDMGIFIGPHAGESIVCFPYRQDRLCLVVPAQHPLAAAGQVTMVELAGCDFIGLVRGSSIAQAVHEESGGRVRNRINVRTTHALCRMVAHGLGVGVAPQMIAEELARTLPIRAVPLDAPWAARQLLVGVRSEQGLSAPARLFLDHCRSQDASSSNDA